ncbi:MAG: 23S rRNA (guanosine(2251)-2'-O)-methyltransferase RlmB [Thermodesulfobacteriota bacterium]
MKKHEQNQQSIVAGRKSVLEYLAQAGDKVDQVWLQKGKEKELGQHLELCRSKKIRFQLVDRAALDRATGDIKHQGVLARVFQPGFCSPEEILQRLHTASLPLILALDQVQDSGNLGVLARTLLALGGAGLVLPKNRTVSPGSRAEKSAAGALSRLPVSRVTNLARFLELCQAEKVQTYYSGTDPECQDVYRLRLETPAVLVLGNEEKGVRPGVRKRCACGLSIPMCGDFDSLNVAQAGAIILGEFLRRSSLDVIWDV